MPETKRQKYTTKLRVISQIDKLKQRSGTLLQSKILNNYNLKVKR